MTKSILAALFAAAVLTSGAAYADGPAAPAMAPSVGTQTIIGVSGGETYPQFGPANRPITSRPMTALNGEQYPNFSAPSQSVHHHAYARVQTPPIPGRQRTRRG